MTNTEVVQKIYEAFGRGDVPAILERLADDVDWEYGASTAVPWLQPYKRRADVGNFFASLAGLEITKFVPKMLMERDGVVIALVDLEARVKATGKSISEEDEVHIWRFDSSGRVARFRHRVDTHQHVSALR